MSGKFSMDDYVDVAQRIQEFYERFPEGSLKSGTPPRMIQANGAAFVMYHAKAYRTPDDPCPTDGWAWEPVPGPTQFTKDSELQNAETAAWGRAIVALGFETKKIASAEEVRNRSAGGPSPASVSERQDRAAGDGTAAAPAPPADSGSFVLPFGKHKGETIAEVPEAYLEWLLTKFEAKTPAHHALIEAVGAFLVPGSQVTFPDDDIPF